MRLILRTAVRSTTAFGSRLRCCAPCAGGLARKARWNREETASLRPQALRYRLGPDCGEVVAKTSSFPSRQFVAALRGVEPLTSALQVTQRPSTWRLRVRAR